MNKLSVAFVYDPATGRILYRATCMPEEFGAYRNAIIIDPEVARDLDDATHWVSDGVIVPRPSMELSVDRFEIEADGADQAAITGIPTGAVMRIDGLPDQVIHDGAVEFSTEVSGEYALRFEAFPHRDAVIKVTAA